MRLLVAVATAALVFQGVAVGAYTVPTSEEYETMDEMTVPDMDQAVEDLMPTLRYEENVGQFHEDVAYSLHGMGSGLYLTDDASAVMTVQVVDGEAGDPTIAPHEADEPEEAPALTYVRMNLVDANEDVTWTGEEQLDSTSNYLVGDEEDWITGVPHVERPVAEEVYEGVDLAWHSDMAGTPKFDFVVDAGAAVDPIGLSFDGVEELTVRDDGSLSIATGQGEVVKPAPYAYQKIDGEEVEVDASYTLTDGVVGFEVGDYDEDETLVIDPAIEYGTYVGGNDYEYPTDVEVDDEGHAHIVGYTRSDDFPTSDGAYQEERIASGWSYDGFATKLNEDGTDVEYSTYFGTTDRDYPRAGADLTDDGKLLVGGYSGGFDDLGGFYSGFVGLLTEDGTDMEFFVPVGSDDSDYVRAGVAVGEDGYYLAGETYGDSLRLGGDASDVGVEYHQDMFVAKIDESASQLEWVANPLAYTSGNMYGLDAADGTVAIAGYEYDGNLDTSDDAYQPDAPGDTRSTFVATYDADSGDKKWATYAGNDGRDYVYGSDIVSIDEGGDVVLAGYTNALRDGYDYDTFAVELTEDGTDAEFHEVIETPDDGSYTYGVDTLDATGHVYLAGSTDSDELPVTEDAFQKERKGESNYDDDGFLMVLDPSGELAFSTYWGGDGADYMRAGVSVGGNAQAAIGGYSYSSQLYTSEDAFMPEEPDRRAAYLAVLQPFDPPTAPLNPSADATGQGEITVSWDAPADDGGLPVDSYNVYRAVEGEPLTQVASTSQTSLVDDGLDDGTSYEYAVAAVNPVDEGPLGETVQAYSHPSGPENLTAEPGPLVVNPTAPGSVHLDWETPGDPADDAIEVYNVYREGADNPIATVEDTEYTDEGLEVLDPDAPGLAEYTYWVTAVNPDGEGADSEEATSTTVPPSLPI